jgi:CBS domain-containing protein
MNGGIINTRLLFVTADSEIKEVVQKMIDRSVSSALIVDHSRAIVGIITERDIVRKFTLLDIDLKLGKKINTIMSRKVHFAHLNTLKRDLIDLHFQHGLPHFPVLLAPEPREENVAGIVTVTDICREYLSAERAHLDGSSPKKVVVLPAPGGDKQILEQTIAGLGYSVVRINAAESAAKACDAHTPLVIDLEGREFADRDRLLETLKHHSGPVVVLNSEKPEHGPLARFLAVAGRTLIVKPFEIPYLDWTIGRATPARLKT